VRIVVSLFYALQDTKTPVKMAIISIIVNVVLGVALMGPLKHGGLALATSLASIVNLLLLTWALRRKIGMLGWRSMMVSAGRSLAISLVMGAAVWGMSVIIIPRGGHSFLQLLLGMTGTIAAGVGLYVSLGVVCGSPELGRLVKALRRR
jgi:putative peptidoglycan lipid II flippase